MRDVEELKKAPGLSLKRYLILFISNVLGVYLISFGLNLSLINLGHVVLLIFIVATFNFIVWPFITKILMPFFVWTFGIAALSLNGGVYVFFGHFLGVDFPGWGVIIVPLTIAFISMILSVIFANHEDNPHYSAMLREAQRKRKGTPKNYPGVIIAEIDGLAYDVLCEAVENGYMPTVKSMIDSKNPYP